MKQLFFLLFLTIPFLSSAQIGLEENHRVKQERLKKYTPLKKGDLTITTGLGKVGSGISLGLGAMFNLNAEYMVRDNVGIRGSFLSNNITGGLRSFGTHRYGLDLVYHFIQTGCWDVYAFAGVGYQRTRYSIMRYQRPNETVHFGNAVLNGGVGARYKITPSFGVQAELGTTSSLGIYKRFGKKR